MTNTRLTVYLHGFMIGTLDMLAPSRYRLTYTEAWQQDPFGMSVSLSLPLSKRVHENTALLGFVDNLLPDNADVRQRWAVDAGLSSTEPFDLLRVHGRDVAGAIQFIPEEAPTGLTSSQNPISNEAIAERIRAIREDDVNWQRQDASIGQFSLGGAQGKFSLGNTGTGWYEPSGDHPTTHIFKPRVKGQIDGELIEFVMMRVASMAGLSTAEVRVGEFRGEHSLVVKRFDRFFDGKSVQRAHQEDLCQSFGISRLQKYEEKGGPNYRRVLQLLRDHGPGQDLSRSRERFVRALVYSWMVLNTDAHAKNYSVFIRAEGSIMTPLYDVSSLLPYGGLDSNTDQELKRAFNKTKLSMRVADEYRSEFMGTFEWQAVAREAGASPSATLEWALQVSDALPQAIISAIGEIPTRLQSPTLERLARNAVVRRSQLLRILNRT